MRFKGSSIIGCQTPQICPCDYGNVSKPTGSHAVSNMQYLALITLLDYLSNHSQYPHLSIQDVLSDFIVIS